MAALSLREQLLAVAGVAEAEVDGDQDAPSGIRVRLAPEADAAEVGAEVQRVLAARGVRSRLGAGESPGPPSSLPASRADAPVTGEPPGRRPAAARALQWVRVEESPAELQITVMGSDGRQVVRSASEVSEAALVEAVIAAVGMLLEGAEPAVLAVEWATVGGSRVVTLVLEGAGGRRGAGAGLVRASLGYAVARAAWSALGD